MTRGEIAKIVRRNGEEYFKCEHFSGNCHYMSAALFTALLKQRIMAKLCRGTFTNLDSKYGCAHYWVESNNTIYDLTAEQFNHNDIIYPAIFVCSTGYSKYKLMNSIMTFDSERVAEFLNWSVKYYLEIVPRLAQV